MSEEHRDGCQCHGCVCSRYELEIHSLTNDIEHERIENARLRELLKEARANLYDMCDAAIVYRIDEALKGQQ